ncbi:hypothetical protein QBC35DRAFT_497557 [Podospora australis]|uniref:Suppressor of anucleate metulae protein B n=1 Tax=Podospora australis TaxID=1536484 RepID=A0AAN6WTT7_9PEZI|nr:hypothetical protein QBC35DRAFT_497557 [Podospora australis]
MIHSPPPPGTLYASGSRGRILVATRDFEPGSIIAKFDAPILALPDGPGATTTCNYCLRVGTAGDLKACNACKAAVYCNQACQRAHWKLIHKHECKVFVRVRQSANKNWLPTPVRAVIQVLFLLKEGNARAIEAFLGGENAAQDNIDDVWVSGDALEDNVEGFKSHPKIWLDFKVQATAAIEYCGWKPTPDTVLSAQQILCQIQTNAFNRFDADSGRSGIFLDPALARINHSCIPNAFVDFHNRTAILRAYYPIKEGEEITLSYTDTNYSKSTRQEALTLYHFKCECPRCSENLDVYEVCQKSPVIPLNTFSLQPDLSKLRNPPVDRSVVSKAQVESIWKTWTEQTMPEEGDPMDVARKRWELCQPLVKAKMWAIEPLPSTLLSLNCHWMSSYKWVFYSLPLACFLATEIDPYRNVVPFFPWRLKGVVAIVKLLTLMGSLTATGELAKRCPHEGIVGVLAIADEVLICEGLLRLVIKQAEIGAGEDWDVLQFAKEMLKDLETLPGRKKESDLIRKWAENPEDGPGKAFFESEVLKPVRVLASFAPEILDDVLGKGLGLVRT